MHEWLVLAQDNSGPLNLCVPTLQSLALLQMEWKVCIKFNVKFWLDLLAVVMQSSECFMWYAVREKVLVDMILHIDVLRFNGM